MKKPDDLYLELITPEGILYDGSVGLIELPGASGRFMILREHGSIISTLKEGYVRIIGKDSVERRYDCTGGVVECIDNHVSVLINNTVKN